MRRVRFGAAIVLAALAAATVSLADQAPAPAKSAPAALVNINTAPADQLESLPGVGSKMAARIVEYRQKSGTFRSTQELMNVKGVGEKNFAKIEAWLSVGEAPKAAAK